jgi:hypothetical protein
MRIQEAKAAVEHHTERDKFTATSTSWAKMERTFIQELLNHPKPSSSRPVATTFPCFPKLPPEIRQMLWTYILCHPEINDSTSFPKMLKQHSRLLEVYQESAGCVVRSLHGDLGHYTFVDFVNAQIAVPQYFLHFNPGALRDRLGRMALTIHFLG